MVDKEYMTMCKNVIRDNENMTFFWGFLLGYVVGVLYMCYRSNEDSKRH